MKFSGGVVIEAEEAFANDVSYIEAMVARAAELIARAEGVADGPDGA